MGIRIVKAGSNPARWPRAGAAQVQILERETPLRWFALVLCPFGKGWPLGSGGLGFRPHFFPEIDELDTALQQYDDYGTWLAQLPHTYGDNEWYSGPVADISQVKGTQPPLGVTDTTQPSASAASIEVVPA